MNKLYLNLKCIQNLQKLWWQFKLTIIIKLSDISENNTNIYKSINFLNNNNNNNNDIIIIIY